MKRTLLPLVVILLSLVFFLNRQPSDIQSSRDLTSEPNSHPVRPTLASVSQVPAISSSPDSDAKFAAPLSGSGASKSASTQQESADALASLPSGEQESLWQALSEAQREVNPIPDSHADRPENHGFQFYAVHQEQKMTTRFGPQGMQIVSSRRTYTERDAMDPRTAWQANMRLQSFAGEEISQGTSPERSAQHGSKMEFHHQPGLIEWFDNGEEGMEHG